MESVKKKKVSIYIDPVKYDRLKKVLGAMNVTVTDFMDSMVTDFVDNMEVVVKANDKDLFLKTMSAKVGELEGKIENTFKSK